MIHIARFTFNPFAENTYVLHDETMNCVIIDPGCYDDREREELSTYIKDNSLIPVKLLNTHAHIDHVFGNKYVAEKWKLGLELHKDDLKTLNSLVSVGHLYNLNVEESPQPSAWLEEGQKVKFGNSELDILFTPGHSRGSVCFYHFQQAFVVGGDVLFQGSIGRTDLPGGNHEQLLDSIRTKLFILPEEVVVWPGHGEITTIGEEKEFNPFLK